jgi:hypothetical protein
LARIEWSQEAIRDLERLDRQVVRRILRKLDWFSQNSVRVIPEPLAGEFKGTYKTRRWCMMKKAVKNYNEMSVIERRIGYLVGARLREVDNIKMAMEKQDRIREGHPAPEGWDSVSVIRKWREAR